LRPFSSEKLGQILIAVSWQASFTPQHVNPKSEAPNPKQTQPKAFQTWKI
jgi:hypothetical protein